MARSNVIGHEARLRPEAYVNSYAKRGKTDAENIAEVVTFGCRED
ncbi:hypothetical protein [Phenylobacterium ferrooxidans]|uniref:Uncharacterized protein n=1 Tax=Phenylobacterium ferrooxidans TaxID=2982689 RepID=A0ABW6CPN3_9CAUL